MIEALILALATAQAAPQPMPSMEIATQQVEANDSALFWAAFEGCDAKPLEALLTEDFQMLHDQAGLVVSDRETFLGNIASDCATRDDRGYKNRRLFVPGTRQVTPLGEWGVLERGLHTFHELRQRPAGAFGPDDPGGDTWVQVGGARYMNVWKWMETEGKFRLQQSISVDHASAPPYPPAGAFPQAE